MGSVWILTLLNGQAERGGDGSPPFSLMSVPAVDDRTIAHGRGRFFGKPVARDAKTAIILAYAGPGSYLMQASASKWERLF